MPAAGFNSEVLIRKRGRKTVVTITPSLTQIIAWYAA
jgi:hypothetical protein